MGQYHLIVNLDRKEYINPHRLGCGLKQIEQLGTHPGTGAALLILLASHSTGSGGGDFADRCNDVIGRWRGNRIAMVGDYDDDVVYVTGPTGLTGTGRQIYNQCDPKPEGGEPWTDVSDLVCAELEKQLGGKFQGEGWRDFVYGDGEPADKTMAPDMVIISKR